MTTMTRAQYFVAQTKAFVREIPTAAKHVASEVRAEAWHIRQTCPRITRIAKGAAVGAVIGTAFQIIGAFTK